MKQLLLLLLITVCSFTLFAQANQKPCTAPEASQFDFWLGDWSLFSADTITGLNSIQKVMDGCTIQENFSSERINYIGKSWSVYSPQRKIWQQTWVDNQGAFIYLTGEFKDGVMTLSTAARNMPNGKEMISRMRFYNITKDNFDWTWEATTDAGATWQPNWQIHYVRKK